MSRAELGFVAIHLVLLVPGLALLWTLGMVHRPRDVAGAIGPAYIAGVALVVPAMILLLTLGLSVRLPEFLAVAAALTVLLAAARLAAGRRGRAPGVEEAIDDAVSGRGELWAWRMGIFAIALFFAVGLTAFERLPTGGDDSTIWTYKALALFHLDGNLSDNPALNSSVGAAHLYYPILQPVLESTFFRGMGGARTMEWHIALWVLYGAFVWTVGFLLRRRGVSRLVVLVPVAVLAVAPAAVRGIASGYADVTVACFGCLGALCIGLWVDGAPGRYALLGGLFLGAAANTKNEGQLTALALLLAMAAVVAVGRSRNWRTLAGTAAITVASVLPWVVWRGANGHEDAHSPGLSNALSPSYLADRTDRLDRTVGLLFPEFSTQGNWLWVVPTFLALAIVCLLTGAVRRVAAFYLGAATVMLMGLIWVYWSGTIEINSWLYTSISRTVTGMILVAAAGSAHLATRLATQPPGPAEGR